MRSLLTGAAAAGALMFAFPAGAVDVGSYTLETGTFGTQLGVHSDSSQSSATVSGFVNQEGSDVTFSTNTGILNLTVNGQGEAVIDGDPLLENLLITFEHSWQTVTFSFDNDDGTSDFTLLVDGATLFDSSNCIICVVDDSGQNKFVLSGADFTKLEFNFDPGIDTARQFRLDLPGEHAVPEPATWAMMIMGFGGVGALVRRRRLMAA
jgi:hypothetical protein